MSIKSSRKKSLGFILLVLVLGILVGSALGEIIGMILPDGVVKQFFLSSVSGGISPATTLNAVLFTFTIGFTIKLNVIGVLGILITAYLLRWY